jgi:gliding motility associated protien GldN
MNNDKMKSYMKAIQFSIAKRWMMVIGLSFVICHLSISEAQAQPKKSRVQRTTAQTTQQQKATQGASSSMTRRMQISYPVALDLAEDVVWRRDIYREIDLNDDANAGLYYPVQPQGKEMNLFTYIFKLAQNGYIPIYEYSIANDGNDVFNDQTKVQLKTVLNDRHIFFEEQDGKLKVDNSDIPSQEVTKYYLKESAYYDQGTSTFHRKVIALCPIMMREDDFGEGATKYPLFWVKYDDVAPFLSKHTIMTSNINNSATMSADDYFTLNRYSGKIYKTTNMLGRTLAQYCPDDSAMAREQRRIEQELLDFESNIFGNQAKKDSLDSIAKLQPEVKDKKARKTRRSESGGEEKVSRRKRSSTPSSSSSGAARVSVRRERH